jgi:hypothetical protein
MAILRSLDGKFFEVPDDDLGKYEMSEEKVKAMGGSAEQEQQQMQQPMGQEMGGGGFTVNLNFGGMGQMGQMPMPQAQGKPEGQQQDVQGHNWHVYVNRYWAYRNQYWAYRNHY